jgi:hypothetical protein
LRLGSNGPAGPTEFSAACRERLNNQTPSLVATFIEKASEAFANIEVLDLNDLGCPDGYCAARSALGFLPRG